VPRDEVLDDVELDGGRRREAVALVVGGRGVLEAVVLRQVDADLVAGGGGDVALRLDLLPGDVFSLIGPKRFDAPWKGASKRLGPMRLKTSPSRPSSRTRVAVRPSRRRACSSAVSLKTGAGRRCTSS
jgi:hypothetical protein